MQWSIAAIGESQGLGGCAECGHQPEVDLPAAEANGGCRGREIEAGQEGVIGVLALVWLEGKLGLKTSWSGGKVCRVGRARDDDAVVGINCEHIEE